MRLFRTSLLVAVLAGVCALSPAAQSKTPVRSPVAEITAAVLAAGEPSVKEAKPKKFIAAFAAVINGKPCPWVRKYAVVAVKMRPDLAYGITKVALAAVTPPGAHPDAECVTGLVADLVGADPEGASAIVAAAIAVAPEFQDQIIATATHVAPGQAGNIAAAAAGAFHSSSGVSLTGFGGSGLGVGSINPSNIGGGGSAGGGTNGPTSKASP